MDERQLVTLKIDSLLVIGDKHYLICSLFFENLGYEAEHVMSIQCSENLNIQNQS